LSTTVETPPPGPPPTSRGADPPPGPWRRDLLDRARALWERPGRGAQAGRIALASVGFLVLVRIFFPYSIPELVQGVSLGSLYGILAVGLILIYRTNRIINFAAAAIGAVPAIAGLLLDVQNGVPYLAMLPVAILGGALLGATVDIVVIRRFSRSPRLILTVVTIGVAQALAAVGFFIPVWLGAKAAQIPSVPTPWETFRILDSHGKNLLTGNQVAALVTVVAVAVGLGAFLRYTRIGIALRASAENADRASLLGIPVRRIQTVAWIAAGVLAALALFVQSPLIGVPSDATLGFDSLLYALAAAMVARMERMGVAVLAGMGIGVLITASVARTGSNDLASALMLVVILVALLAQRKTVARAMDAGTSTWELVKSYRPIPTELRGMREVNVARAVLFGVAVLVAVGLPFVVKGPDLPLLILLPIYGIVAVSLVVLTGWAGQISLGQFGLVGAGAAAAGGLIASHNIDFFVAIAIGIGAGVLVAILIGLPAVRIQGLYLAVTTLAFGYAMSGYILKKTHWIGAHLLPTGFISKVSRPLLYGRIDLENDRTFYFLCLAFLVVAMLAAHAFRRNRSGRVLIAARDNQRAAPAYAVNLVRTRLAAFAVSGGIAGLAGVLLVYAQHNVIPGSYDVLGSITLFLAVVIGGLTSVPFAVLGAVSFEAFVLFGPRLYQGLGSTFVAIVPLLLTGPLLVVDLYFYPGGSAEAGFQSRDRFLRWVARRHDLLVPSLVADRRVEAQEEAAADVVTSAEKSVLEADSFASIGPTITCPVCGEVLALDAAAEHEHLQGGAVDGGGEKRLARARARRSS
jgi:branched-chain amino acid transport system permease protein